MTKADIAAILAEYQPRIRAAFLDAIQSIKDHAVLADVAKRLEAYDLDGAVRALHLEPVAFAKVESEITAAYEASGFHTVRRMPVVKTPDGATAVLRFGTRGTEGERIVREQSSKLITSVTDDAKRVARRVFSEGLARGTNPTQTAREVIGTVNRATGKREGGVIGLSDPQAEYVQSAREELASGDSSKLRNYLKRERRDKRFDRSVMKAINEGRPIPQNTIAKMVTSYSNKLMSLRGDAVGLNETLGSMAVARDDAWRQQIEAGKMDARFVTKTWRHSPELHPRWQHLDMDGKTVNFGEDFILPDGTAMKYPHDPSAPPRQTVFCKCRVDIRHRAIDQLLAQRRSG